MNETDAPLPDGSYEAFVVDAEEAGPDGSMLLDLTVLTGPHKGEVITLTATGLGVDPLDLMGIPATLEVAEGHPRVRIDP